MSEHTPIIECDCSPENMHTGRCCKAKSKDAGLYELIVAYNAWTGTSGNRFFGLSEKALESAAYRGFSDFAAGFRAGLAAAATVVEQSQPPDTTPWSCADAIRNHPSLAKAEAQ